MRWKALLCLVLLGLVLLACNDSPENRLRGLEHSWQQGGEARKSLLSKGLNADDKTCRETYTATGAANPSDDKELAALRQTYYVNGCLGLPKPGGTSPASSTASSSTASTTW